MKYPAVFKTLIGDDELKTYCNPTIAKKPMGAVIRKICEDIDEWVVGANANYDEVILDGEPIGFVVYTNEYLVSFGVKKEYRKKEVLVKFFDLIKSFFEEGFECYMWKRNTRGIKWLKKCGMKIDRKYKKKEVVKLKF